MSNNIYRTYHGYDTILLLTLLMNVETDKKTNPYVVKLSLLDKEDVLNGYSQVKNNFFNRTINIFKNKIILTIFVDYTLVIKRNLSTISI